MKRITNKGDKNMESIEKIKKIIDGPRTSEEEKQLKEKAAKDEFTKEELEAINVEFDKAAKKIELDKFIKKEREKEK